MHRLSEEYGNALHEKKLLQFYMPVLRADLAICNRYEYHGTEKLPVPITAFGGCRDSIVSTDEIRAWQAHTDTGFQFVSFEGSHLFLNDQPSAVVNEIMNEMHKAF